MKNNKQAVKERGEVFTPPRLVNEVLDKLPQDILLNPEKVIGDIAGCGNGNFLVEVLNRRMNAGISHLDALKTIYGIEIHQPNVDECKRRLSLGSTDREIWKILNHNIVCADALDDKHPGWNVVGYMWEPNYNFF
jgi:type I restriction-modification system DNA methylase subunit